MHEPEKPLPLTGAALLVLFLLAGVFAVLAHLAYMAML